ncbi:hypothetical protein [Neorhizobium sp. JUb45]|uniref:hypothetical protein n=1 Tax=unclassified Neorhizobium TaxID=2629175 RepID=UPI001FE1E0EB|nr:hypothetical protein [Neorhizobium sp. JUb45]
MLDTHVLCESDHIRNDIAFLDVEMQKDAAARQFENLGDARQFFQREGILDLSSTATARAASEPTTGIVSVTASFSVEKDADENIGRRKSAPKTGRTCDKSDRTIRAMIRPSI